MKKRFKLITEKNRYPDEDVYTTYHIVDTKLSWRIASNIGMQPDGEPALEVAKAMVEFLNQRYP